VTGTPDVTPPPTDSPVAPSGTNDAWRLVLIGLAGILAAMLLLTPASKNRSDRR
jgi:hypothetical protein